MKNMPENIVGEEAQMAVVNKFARLNFENNTGLYGGGGGSGGSGGGGSGGSGGGGGGGGGRKSSSRRNA